MIRFVAGLCAGTLYAVAEAAHLPILPMKTWLDSPFRNGLILSWNTILLVYAIYLVVCGLQAVLMCYLFKASYTLRVLTGFAYNPERAHDD